MNGNISGPKANYIEVDVAAAANIFTIAGGGAGWIDTDITGSDVPRGAICIVFSANPSANQNLGARANGSAIDTKINNAYTIFITTTQSAAGHVDFYRAAANNVYTVRGYFI